MGDEVGLTKNRRSREIPVPGLPKNRGQRGRNVRRRQVVESDGEE